jgi:arsenite methyltransferase
MKSALRKAIQVVSVTLLAWLVSLLSSPPPTFAQHSDTQQSGTHLRRPSDIQEYLQHLDRAERDRDQKPSQVVEALELKPGMVVADLGAGSGYFTRRFAEAVTDEGKVYAIDIELDMLAYTKESLAQTHAPHRVEFILADPDNPRLPAGSVDLIFVCNVYHHLENRPTYFAHAAPALKPGGRVAVIDFYHDRRSGDVGFPRRHLVARETVIDEMGEAGYTLLREHGFLSRQYFLEFILKSR